MEQCPKPLQAAAAGHLPPEEPLAAEVAAMPLALGAAGVRGPFRPEGGQPTGKTAWPEVTGGVLARWGRHTTRTGKSVARPQQRRLGAVFGDIEALQRRLWLVALRPGLMGAPQVGWLSDGARGLWRRCEERFTADAPGLWAFYPAVQQLWKRAAAWLDGRTTQARRGGGWARHRLRPGHAAGGLADLAAALDVEGLPETAPETLRTVYTYLERHREPID